MIIYYTAYCLFFVYNGSHLEICDILYFSSIVINPFLGSYISQVGNMIWHKTFGRGAVMHRIDFQFCNAHPRKIIISWYIYLGKPPLAKYHYITNISFNYIIITEEYVCFKYIYIYNVVWKFTLRDNHTCTSNMATIIVISSIWGKIYILYITY